MHVGTAKHNFIVLDAISYSLIYFQSAMTKSQAARFLLIYQPRAVNACAIDDIGIECCCIIPICHPTVFQAESAIQDL